MKRIKTILFGLFLFGLSACTSTNVMIGEYRSIFPQLGFFGTRITLKSDSTFHYVFSGDLIQTDLEGIYTIRDKSLYLRFCKLKEESKTNVSGIGEGSDSVLKYDDSQNTHSYDLKEEGGIKYHLKYHIKGSKLKPYHIETNKIVHRAKYYSDKKRYIIWGPNYRMKKWYLKKIE